MEPQLFILPETDPDSDTGADTDAPAGNNPVVEFSPPPRWRLDDHTRDVGRRGIAKARAALRDATRTAAEQGRSAA
jgi:hypothetical protein